MFYRTIAASLMLATSALAEAPKVVTDIAPIHSLVARVMQGVGAPDLLLQPGISPHDYAMRPSEARLLQTADLVVWMGEDLTPWLEHSLESLAGDARLIELLHLEGTLILETRDTAIFSHDDHEGEEADGHEDEHHHGHDHDHGSIDPHAWLAPENAQVWLTEISEILSEIDPNNAELYATNASVALTEIVDLVESLRPELAEVHDRGFIVLHDAFQYFENSFDLHVAGALQVSDAVLPSAARLADIQHEMEEQNITCIFSEPQLNDAVLRAIAPEGTQTAVLDPIGVNHPIGPAHYHAMLRDLVEATKSCLTDK